MLRTLQTAVRTAEDDRDAFSLSVQELLEAIIMTCIRTCLMYPPEPAIRFHPPLSVNCVDIDRRKMKTFVIAMIEVLDHWWKVEAAVAGICGLRPSLVKMIDPVEVQFQDLIAYGASGYIAAVDKGTKITYVQISVPLDWRKVFDSEHYTKITGRKKWMSCVAGVEKTLAWKLQLDMKLKLTGTDRGMLDYNTIRNDSPNCGGPNPGEEEYRLFTDKKNRAGFADTCKWIPSKCRIEY